MNTTQLTAAVRSALSHEPAAAIDVARAVSSATGRPVSAVQTTYVLRRLAGTYEIIQDGENANGDPLYRHIRQPR